MDEDRYSKFFAAQHGLITRRQAGNDAAIRHRIDNGRWARVAAGVYRLAGAPVTWPQRALAACLAAGPGAVVSHRAAGVLLGVSGFRPGGIDITVPPGRSARSPLATVHRSHIRPGERTTRERIPVTKPARMIADLARTEPAVVLEEAVDDLLCRRLVALDQLAASARGRLAQVLAAWSPGAPPDSIAEMAVVRALLESGLPPPRRQHWIGEAVARVDLAYPEDRIAIELDSFRWHAGRRPFASDRTRGNRIVAAGWRLLRATPGDLQPTVTATQALLWRSA